MALLTDVGTYLDAATVATADLTLGAHVHLFAPRAPDLPRGSQHLTEQTGTTTAPDPYPCQPVPLPYPVDTLDVDASGSRRLGH